MLIAWLLICAGLWDLGHQTHDWAPLVVAAIAGPVIIWLHRHNWL